MRFRDIIKENVYGINDYNLGMLISDSMFMVAQIHVWHLLCPSGQKHMALGELYEELQTEVDSLAERFIAQGGILNDSEFILSGKYDEFSVYESIRAFRQRITNTLDDMNNVNDLASVIDSVVDLQEIIDSKLYKFKLQ